MGKHIHQNSKGAFYFVLVISNNADFLKHVYTYTHTRVCVCVSHTLPDLVFHFQESIHGNIHVYSDVQEKNQSNQTLPSCF